MHGGRLRSYILRLPPAMPPGGVPLVLVLHGGGGNGVNAESMTDFTSLARAKGFIVAYPDGSARGRGGLLTWNAGHCCGYAMQSNVDDVGFLSALIDDLRSRYPIDSKRVYVTGISNGAMMAHRVGRELPQKVAAIAPVVGDVFGDEKAPTTTTTEAWMHIRYNCPAGMGVEWYGLRNNGHAWPGGRAGSRFGDEPDRSLMATQVIWDFFAAHPKR